MKVGKKPIPNLTNLISLFKSYVVETPILVTLVIIAIFTDGLYYMPWNNFTASVCLYVCMHISIYLFVTDKNKNHASICLESVLII